MTKKSTKKATEKEKVLRSSGTSTDIDTAVTAVQAVGTDLGTPLTTGKAYKSLHATRAERDMVKKLKKMKGDLHKWQTA